MTISLMLHMHINGIFPFNFNFEPHDDGWDVKRCLSMAMKILNDQIDNKMT